MPLPPASSTSRRRHRRPVATVLLLVVVVWATASVTTPAGGLAGQEDGASVRAGWNGWFRPGATVPVWTGLPAGTVVEIGVRSASGLTTRVRAPVPDDPAAPVVVRTPLDLGSLTIEVRALGDDVPRPVGDVTLEPLRDDEVVGVLPGLGTPVPGDPVPLIAAAGTATVVSLSEPQLVPGALAPLGSVVAGEKGLDGLGEVARRALTAWVASGGTLLVDGPLPVPGLPEQWQPEARMGRVPAGLGEVRSTGGRLSAGDWVGTLEPTSTVTTLDPAVTTIGYAGGGLVGDSLAADAGFRLPPVHIVAAVLVLYVVVAGPVLFRLLRSGDRRRLAWVAVPTLAALAATAFWWSGEQVRADRRVAYGRSVIETAAADLQLAHVATVASGDETFRATFPEGWTVVNAGNDPEGTGPLATVRTSRTGSDPAVEAAVELAGTDRGVLVAGGSTAPTRTLVVTARTAGSTVVGQVSNVGEETLEHVAVFVGNRSEIVGTVPAGASVDWTISGLDIPDIDALFTPSELRVWADVVDSDELGRPVGAVNPSVWSALLDTVGPNFRGPGTVVAAGWTTDAEAPFEADGDVSGRTVVVGRATIASEGKLTGWDVRRDLLRGPGSLAVRDLDGQLVTGSTGMGLVRFVLPPGRVPSDLVLSVPATIGKVEVRAGGAWRSLDVPTGLADPNAPPTLVPVPARIADDGVIFLRFATRVEASPAGGTELLLRERP